jgi:hypothetical protein
MERMKETSIYWQRPYGWRAGSRNIEPSASAVDVIRYEQEEYENDLDIPDFLLEELTHKQVSASEVVWVCRTRQHAKRYSSQDIGQPYREDFSPHALILATDHEAETGYLVLFDASRLDPVVLEQYARYRKAQLTGKQTQARTLPIRKSD